MGGPGLLGSGGVLVDQDTVETRASLLQRRGDGVIRHTLNGLPVEGSDVQEWGRAYEQLGGGEPVRLLFDLGAFRAVSSEARKLAASEAHAEGIRAVAFIATSAVGRVIGNFWLGLNRPPYPTRLFTDEESALDWLLGQGD
jgi:hypothetical protein